ncbi:MAG TPA: flagellar export chaperone FliS [Solirubrobacteraceae bacterium]|nr:flagellar export chaperone FliS [Solirubrobacteraceae bacterium]
MTPPLTSPQAYRENTVLSATPAQLVVMLYDGAQRFLRQATVAMQAREIERAHNALRRVELILAHLDQVLDHDQDPRLAAQLSAVYQFWLSHLRRARFDQDPAKIEDVSRLLGELRESWAEIARG